MRGLGHGPQATPRVSPCTLPSLDGSLLLQAVWADADKYMEEMEAEQELEQHEKQTKKEATAGTA